MRFLLPRCVQHLRCAFGARAVRFGARVVRLALALAWCLWFWFVAFCTSSVQLALTWCVWSQFGYVWRWSAAFQGGLVRLALTLCVRRSFKLLMHVLQNGCRSTAPSSTLPHTTNFAKLVQASCRSFLELVVLFWWQTFGLQALSAFA